eukprot:GHVP01024463.1.p1 GENE.GHVP01024463.1~~GHVP01024463.1.p1  ORF type:complete len:127 (+),score=31.13 GHVP01024463.1:39-419(+)
MEETQAWLDIVKKEIATKKALSEPQHVTPRVNLKAKWEGKPSIKHSPKSKILVYNGYGHESVREVNENIIRRIEELQEIVKKECNTIPKVEVKKLNFWPIDSNIPILQKKASFKDGLLWKFSRRRV